MKGGVNMTWTIQTEKIGNYSISIEQDKYSSGYTVKQNRCVNKDLNYYVMEKENYYPTIEKAKRRFAALRRNLRKEM